MQLALCVLSKPPEGFVDLNQFAKLESGLHFHPITKEYRNQISSMPSILGIEVSLFIVLMIWLIYWANTFIMCI